MLQTIIKKTIKKANLDIVSATFPKSVLRIYETCKKQLFSNQVTPLLVMQQFEDKDPHEYKFIVCTNN